MMTSRGRKTRLTFVEMQHKLLDTFHQFFYRKEIASQGQQRCKRQRQLRVRFWGTLLDPMKLICAVGLELNGDSAWHRGGAGKARGCAGNRRQDGNRPAVGNTFCCLDLCIWAFEFHNIEKEHYRGNRVSAVALTILIWKLNMLYTM